MAQRSLKQGCTAINAVGPAKRRHALFQSAKGTQVDSRHAWAAALASAYKSMATVATLASMQCSDNSPGTCVRLRRTFIAIARADLLHGQAVVSVSGMRRRPPGGLQH